MPKRCKHRNTDFDRTLCPEPCGMFHTYCQDCGECLDKCAHEHPREDDAMKPLPCIVCGIQPKPVFPNSSNTWQPSGATVFDAGCGNYGSTVWDTTDSGRSLMINVCDSCLVTHRDRVAEMIRKRPIQPEFEFVPWEPPKDMEAALDIEAGLRAALEQHRDDE